MESVGRDVPRRVRRGVVDDALPELGLNGSIRLIPATHSRPPIEHPVLAWMNTVWSLEGFETPRSPLLVNLAEDAAAFSRPEDLYVADMPIKAPGSSLHLLPSELAGFREVLQQCINFEASVNDRYEADYFTYLTVHRARVARGDSLRGGLPHSDSLQGPRIQPKSVIEHGYLVANVDPPRFYPQAFDLTGLDSDVDDVARVLAEQANDRKSFQGVPYGIYLFDAYCVHEAVPAAATDLRTFFRLTMSTREFDRLGNTRHSGLGIWWPLVARPVDPTLR